MKARIDIRYFDNQKYRIRICGLERDAPLYQVEKELWIVGNDHLSFGCDIEFTERIGGELALRLGRFLPQMLITPEARALALVYEIAKNLKHPGLAVARKSIKPGMGDLLMVDIKSITTQGFQKLVLDEYSAEKIRGKRVALVDDVISTGETVEGLKLLAERAGAAICAIATVWMEGPWGFERFRKELKSGELIYIDVLPLFARGDTYRRLLDLGRKVEDYFA